jgi:hypothetical protein
VARRTRGSRACGSWRISPQIGRSLLRVLRQQISAPVDKAVINALPAHCLPVVAQLARNLALQWKQISVLAEVRAEVEAG